MQYIILVLIILFSKNSFASFTYNQAPINPLVIPTDEGRTVLIKNEMNKIKQEYQILGKIPQFHYTIPTNQSVAFKIKGQNYGESFRSYHYVGFVNGHHIIILYENMGGSGTFSYLMKLQYNKNTGELTLPQSGIISTGDRASGGLDGFAFIDKDNKLIYQINANAFTLMHSIGIEDMNILENLSYCMICEIAKMRFSYNFDSNSKSVEEIRFYPLSDIKTTLSEGNYNDLLRRIIQKFSWNNVILREKNLANFVRTVNSSFKK